MNTKTIISVLLITLGIGPSGFCADAFVKQIDRRLKL
jgi:hypothetical protein